MAFINVYATKVHKKKPIIKQLYRKVTTDLKTSSEYSQASFMCAQEIPFQTTVIKFFQPANIKNTL